MESFYSQLLIVLVIIIALLVFVLVYRKMLDVLKKGENENVHKCSPKDLPAKYESKIHARKHSNDKDKVIEVDGSV